MRTFKIRCSAIGKIMGESKPKGGLSTTCITYLKEWYADEHIEIKSKYLDKGKAMESEAIEFASLQLGIFDLKKNIDIYSNDFMTGEPDVLFTKVLDIKCPFDRKTFLDNVSSKNSDYEWQLQGYMELTNRKEAILFYALMNTPAEINYGNFISYDHIPDNQRWIAFEYKHNPEMIEQIKQKVEMCRKWLNEYDKLVSQNLGKIND